jgi:hypothetical protein
MILTPNYIREETRRIHETMERNSTKDKVFLYRNDVQEVLSALWTTSYNNLLEVQQEIHQCIPKSSPLNVDKGKMDAFVEIGKEFGLKIGEKCSSGSKADRLYQKIDELNVVKVLDSFETQWKKELNEVTLLTEQCKFLETAGKIVALQQVKQGLLFRMSLRAARE